MKRFYMAVKKVFCLCFIFFLCTKASVHNVGRPDFSQCYSAIIPNNEEKYANNPELALTKAKDTSTLVWTKKTNKPFSELILSWNAIRPQKGNLSFFINIRHHHWSGWHRLAEWGANHQKTFCNTRNRFVHVKHVRAEMQRNRLGSAFQIKVVAQGGAKIENLKALFANTSKWDAFVTQNPPLLLSSTRITNVPRHSQWWIKHERAKDLCSPTSINMIAHYFAIKHDFVVPEKNFNRVTATFADNVRDHSLNIFGNWLFNVTEAYNTTIGQILYRVERLNDFQTLHAYLKRNTPVSVSIRGYLHGCAWPYKNGHFVVVIGWDKKAQRVICIDPAFRDPKHLVRRYRIRDFLNAWGKSKNLAYVPIPQKKLLKPPIKNNTNAR